MVDEEHDSLSVIDECREEKIREHNNGEGSQYKERRIHKKVRNEKRTIIKHHKKLCVSLKSFNNFPKFYYFGVFTLPPPLMSSQCQPTRYAKFFSFFGA